LKSGREYVLELNLGLANIQFNLTYLAVTVLAIKDPFDDHVLEVAVASESPYIVSYNKKDFKAAKSFGIEIVSPFEFLKTLGGNT